MTEIKLFNHQKEALTWLKARKNGGLLAHDMGLGKTLTAILAAENYTEQEIHVIVPASLKLNWEREIWKFASKPSRFKVFKYTEFSLKRKIDAITKPECGCVILDESHFVKTHTSARTKEITARVLSAKEKKTLPVILLTGTPITKEVTDLFSQLLLIDAVPLRKSDGKPWNFFGFRNAFQNSKPTYGGHKEYYGVKNEGYLNSVLETCMLMRKKEQVLDLPEKVRNERVLETKLSKDLVSKLDEVMNFISFDEETGSVKIDKDAEQRLHVATLRKFVGISKVETTLSYLKDIAENGSNEPIIIFAHHKEVIANLSQGLKDCPTITGETPLHQRQSIVDAFQSGHLKYIVCNIQSAGVGLTLTRSKHIVFAELDWSPSNLRQAEDRIHRIGQKNNVVIDYILINHDFELKMLKNIKNKLDIISKTVEYKIA